MLGYISVSEDSALLGHTAEEAIMLREVCKMLGISLATGRNWVRLGKLTPLNSSKKPMLFSKNQVAQLLESIANSETKTLKSRRNKRKVSGNKLYLDYVGVKDNVSAISSLVEILPTNIGDLHIRVILANAVLQLATQLQNIVLEGSTNLVESFIDKKLAISFPEALIYDILGDTAELHKVFPDIAEILKIRFIYSQKDDVLGLIYMSIRNIANRKASGAYYTPAKIVGQLIEALSGTVNLSQKTCLDPCCGSGNFLLSVADTVNDYTMVYGQDNDQLAVLLTRANFALSYKISDIDFLYEHFTVGDSLQHIPDRQYDIIIGNPPWGYEFSEDEIERHSQKYSTATSNNIESYDLFVERAMSTLPYGGVLAFVLPEAILNVKTHEAVRNILIEKGSFSFVSYIGNVFPGVQCPAVILGVKKESSNSDIQVYCDGKRYSISGAQKFTSNNINLRSSDKERECLQKISFSEHKAFLVENAIFALGIVTGNNRHMVLTTQEDDCEIILKGSDIRKYVWEPGGSYIRFTPERFQQVAPTEYYRAPEKLLYRFICDTPVFAYDNRQTLSLNSCNILIPRIEGLSVKYILAILNSRVVDFFIRQTFSSVKLLRSHIEQVPIPVPSDAVQHQLVRKVDDILSGRHSVSYIYEEIDNAIMDLYGLSHKEKDIIRSYCDGRNMFLGRG